MCSICWDEIEDPSVQLACKHRFHYRCITEWSRRNHQCPLCRQDFTARPPGAALAVRPDEEDGGAAAAGGGFRRSFRRAAEAAAPPGLLLHGREIGSEIGSEIIGSEIGSEHAVTVAAVISSITVWRTLAILFPNFVERLFAPQIKFGRQLQGLWRRPDFAFPSIVAALILFFS